MNRGSDDFLRYCLDDVVVALSVYRATPDDLARSELEKALGVGIRILLDTLEDIENEQN